jgi:hypothetical protein
MKNQTKHYSKNAKDNVEYPSTESIKKKMLLGKPERQRQHGIYSTISKIL